MWERVRGSAIPFQAVVSGRWGAVFGKLSEFAARAWPSLFAFQFVVTCRPRAGVMQLIRNSEQHRLLDPSVAAWVVASAPAEGRVAADASRPQ